MRTLNEILEADLPVGPKASDRTVGEAEQHPSGLNYDQWKAAKQSKPSSAPKPTQSGSFSASELKTAMKGVKECPEDTFNGVDLDKVLSQRKEDVGWPGDHSLAHDPSMSRANHAFEGDPVITTIVDPKSNPLKELQMSDPRKMQSLVKEDRPLDIATAAWSREQAYYGPLPYKEGFYAALSRAAGLDNLDTNSMYGYTPYERKSFLAGYKAGKVYTHTRHEIDESNEYADNDTTPRDDNESEVFDMKKNATLARNETSDSIGIPSFNAFNNAGPDKPKPKKLQEDANSDDAIIARYRQTGQFQLGDELQLISDKLSSFDGISPSGKFKTAKHQDEFKRLSTRYKELRKGGKAIKEDTRWPRDAFLDLLTQTVDVEDLIIEPVGTGIAVRGDQDVVDQVSKLAMQHGLNVTKAPIVGRMTSLRIGNFT